MPVVITDGDACYKNAQRIRIQCSGTERLNFKRLGHSDDSDEAVELPLIPMLLETWHNDARCTELPKCERALRETGIAVAVAIPIVVGCLFLSLRCLCRSWQASSASAASPSAQDMEMMRVASVWDQASQPPSSQGSLPSHWGGALAADALRTEVGPAPGPANAAEAPRKSHHRKSERRMKGVALAKDRPSGAAWGRSELESEQPPHASLSHVADSAETITTEVYIQDVKDVITAEEEAANSAIVQSLQREMAEAAEQERKAKASAESVPAEETAAMPFSADPFADLLATIMLWLQQAGGTLEREAVLPLIKAMGFRVRAVINGLQDVFWSHPEAECEILLRTAAGSSLHPKPLPANYLHEAVRRNLVLQVRQMGSKAKYDKLAGLLGWNAKSELRRTYGALRIVLAGLPEIFYDSHKLYLKQVLEGVVDWPVSKDGRIGPNGGRETVQHWTRACDDLKGAGDIDWFNAKRQLLGVVMNQGGHCDVQVARWLLQPAGEATLEKVFEVGSKYDLTKVLFWEPRRVFKRRQPMAAQDETKASSEICQVVRKVMDSTVSATLEELKAAVETNLPGKDGGTSHVGQWLGCPSSALRTAAAKERCTGRALATGSLPGEALGPNVPGGASKLGDIAKVPLLLKESPVKVREIWLERFRENPVTVAGAVSDQDYRPFQANAEACPMFVVPLPRGEGFLNMVWQVQDQRVLFKTLDGFQQGSPVIDLGVSFFTELIVSHQLVLIHGEIKSNLLSKEEASRMVRFLREAYADPTLFGWVKRFNQSPREFDWQDFMSQARPVERWQSYLPSAAADEDVVRAAVQEIAELFFLPDEIFLRHVATGSILQSSLPEDVQEDVDDDEELMREGLAEVAAAAAAIKEPAEDPLQIQAPKANAAAVSQVQHAGMDLGFLSFAGFKSRKVEPDLAQPAKRPKLVPSWLVEGAAVHVRRGVADVIGTILEIKGDLCRVRTLQPAPQGSDLGAEEREEMLPLPAILPVAPEIGRSVKVVAGDRTGIIGKLVGLAGTEAVVQIGGMCYETLPMTQIAVVSN
eukprot:s3970_g2.t2